VLSYVLDYALRREVVCGMELQLHAFVTSSKCNHQLYAAIPSAPGKETQRLLIRRSPDAGNGVLCLVAYLPANPGVPVILYSKFTAC
jgi:hypothetical protein